MGLPKPGDISAHQGASATYYLLAVFVECRLDKERSQSKAQSIISVADTSLPAWGTGLQ